MDSPPFLIIDFDSTFVSVEALDELAEISLPDGNNKRNILQKIKEINNRGMEGALDFPTSLRMRLALFRSNLKHVHKLITFLKEHITTSVVRNKEFFMRNSKYIYIVSGGFVEYIAPVVEEFGITKNHILANRFTFNEKKDIIGFEEDNLLAQLSGKVKAVTSLGLRGKIYVIGDGFTDYEIKKNGAANMFFAFTENIKRSTVVKKADRVIKNFDELIK